MIDNLSSYLKIHIHIHRIQKTLNVLNNAKRSQSTTVMYKSNTENGLTNYNDQLCIETYKILTYI